MRSTDFMGWSPAEGAGVSVEQPLRQDAPEGIGEATAMMARVDAGPERRGDDVAAADDLAHRHRMLVFRRVAGEDVRARQALVHHDDVDGASDLTRDEL